MGALPAILPGDDDWSFKSGRGGGGGYIPGGGGGMMPVGAGMGGLTFGAGPAYNYASIPTGFKRRFQSPLGAADAGTGGIDYGSLWGGQNVGAPDPNNGRTLMPASSFGSFGGLEDFIAQLMSSGYGAGMFDPSGNAALTQALMGGVASEGGARQAGMRNATMLSGLDNPNAYAMGTLMGDLGLQRDISQAGSQARLQGVQTNQDFLRSIMGGNLQNELQRLLTEYSQSHGAQANIGQAGAGQKSSSWWQDLAGIGGSILGGFAGGGW